VLALLVALQGLPPAPPPSTGWLSTGRLIDTPGVHLGIRPAIDVTREDWAFGVTVQASTLAL
jgi:hypothetical protein